MGELMSGEPRGRTRRGSGIPAKGPGWGGPAKGLGWGGPASGAGWGGPVKGAGRRFGPNANSQGQSKATPAAAGNKRAARAERAEALLDVLYDLAISPDQPSMTRVHAIDKFLDRVERKAVARQEFKLDVDPKDLSDAELMALIQAGQGSSL